MTAARFPGAADEQQAAAAALMIRPRHFGSNAETLASNRFQSPRSGSAAFIETRAIAEFDALAAALSRAGVTVHVLDGRSLPACPDETFPNNWISTHGDGTLVLYPMMAPSRRLERRDDIVATLCGLGYEVRDVVDLTELEQRGEYLEGTGSLVLDRPARTAYACRSARTLPEAVNVFAARMHYETLLFDARGHDGHAIYHTNVMMALGTRFAVVCCEAIASAGERRRVLERLENDGRQIIEIDFAQLAAFAANLLELRGADGPVIALSQRALASLDASQRRALAAHGEIVAADVGAIETYGGGGVRCMLAEVHLPSDVTSAGAAYRGAR